MRLALLLAALVLGMPLAAAYPDPGKVPRYYDSPCYQEHDRRFVHDHLGILPADYAAEMEEWSA